MKNDDLISRQAAIDAIRVSTSKYTGFMAMEMYTDDDAVEAINGVPSAQPEHLTDDDFETIRIHLSAIKEELCNQHRWKEAEEYQHIIDRFMAFASEQPGRKKGKWILSDEQRQEDVDNGNYRFVCSECGNSDLHSKAVIVPFCWNCGADMRRDIDNIPMEYFENGGI